MARTLRLPAVVSALAFAALILASAAPAWARPNGITGYSGKNNGLICNDCHSGGTAPMLTLIGPASLTPGQVGEYVLKVTTGAARAGMAAAATDGAVLAAGANTKTLNAEVTHMQPTTPANGAVDFEFKLTAPATPGPITIWVAGNAVDNSGSPAGDLAAATTKIVTVAAVAPVVLDSGAPPAAGPSSDGGAPPIGAGPGASTPSAKQTLGDGGSMPFSAGTDEPFDPSFAETGLSCTVGRTPSPIEPGTLALIGLAMVAAGARWGRRRGEGP